MKKRITSRVRSTGPWPGLPLTWGGHRRSSPPNDPEADLPPAPYLAPALTAAAVPAADRCRCCWRQHRPALGTAPTPWSERQLPPRLTAAPVVVRSFFQPAGRGRERREGVEAGVRVVIRGPRPPEAWQSHVEDGRGPKRAAMALASAAAVASSSRPAGSASCPPTRPRRTRSRKTACAWSPPEPDHRRPSGASRHPWRPRAPCRGRGPAAPP